MRTRVSLTALAAALALSLTGCSGSGNDLADQIADEIAQEAAAQAGDVTTDEAATSPAPTVAVFDEPFDTDQFTVTVTRPEPYTSSWPGELPDGTTPVRTTVTVTVNSGDAWDASDFTLSGLSGNRQVERLFDGNQGIEHQSVTVPTGRSLTFDVGLAVTDPADVVLTVGPTYSSTVTLAT